MTPATTLGTYAAALALVFAGAVGIGQAVGPVGTASAGAEQQDGHGDVHGGGTEVEPAAGGDAQDDEAARPPGGLAVAQDGYALRLEQTTIAAGSPGTLQLSITGPDGEPLGDYTRSHDKELHLIVVRRDLTGFQHLHPTRDAQDRWSVPLTLAQPGTYKVIADFTPAGRQDPLALAADLTAPGSYTPAALPAERPTATVDGYTVALEGRLVAGESSRLALTVSRDGRPVTDLQPYLGAYGHLVALRAGDLAYLHVHPDESAGGQGAGPQITFFADVPAAGPHRLFLDFQHEGVVRTAELTANAAAPHTD